MLCIPLVVGATLGQHADNAANDQAHMKEKATSPTKAANGAYTLHEQQLSSGSAVREYADANGTVFAVVWDGPTKPDLNQLLGKYFAEYQNGTVANSFGHNKRVSRKPDIVIWSEGRMRAFYGKAYLPQSIPAGVRVEDLQ